MPIFNFFFAEMDLIAACRNGVFARVVHLIQNKLADVNERDSEDCTPLHWAAIVIFLFNLSYYFGIFISLMFVRTIKLRLRVI